jgi:hypothetical protein
MDDGFLQADPQAEKWAYLENAGTYGLGQQYEADVEVADVSVCNAEGNGPGYDRNCERDTYHKWSFRVVTADAGLVNVDEWCTTKKFSNGKSLVWARNCGATVSEEGVFNKSEVVGKKVAITVGEPYTSKAGNKGTGRVQEVFAL